MDVICLKQDRDLKPAISDVKSRSNSLSDILITVSYLQVCRKISKNVQMYNFISLISAMKHKYTKFSLLLLSRFSRVRLCATP